MKLPLPVWVLLLSSTGWGLTWLPLRYFERVDLAGPLVIFIAFSSATVMLLPMLFRQRHAWMGSLNYMFLIVIFGGLANLSFQAALYYGDVVRVMILFYLLPVWSVLGGRIFLGEVIDRVRIIALLAALSGGFMILGGMGLFSQPPNWIDLLAILSGFALAMNNLVFRAAQSIPSTSKVEAMFIGATLLTGIFILFDQELGELPTLEITSLAAIYGVVWLTLISFGTQWAVTRLEAGRSSIIMVMELVVAVVSAVIILDQSLSVMEVTGALLVIAAALLEGLRGGQDANVATAINEKV